MAAQRILIAAFGVVIAFFAFWGAWEMARQTPVAPQALLGALAFVVIGLITLAAAALGVLTERSRAADRPEPPARDRP